MTAKHKYKVRVLAGSRSVAQPISRSQNDKSGKRPGHAMDGCPGARLPAAFLTWMELIDTFRMAFAARLRSHCALNSRPRRLARPRTPPFHGDNTGSNPVG